MRKLQFALLIASFFVLTLPQLASAAKPVKGFMPPGVGARGHSMLDIATAWTVWAFGTGDGGPILEARCEQSPIDKKIWFLPVSIGDDAPVACDVPQGAWLLISPGGSECSNLEEEPWFGADPDDLGACVEETFEDLTYLDLTLDGRTTTEARLQPYILTTRTVDLPADNLLSSDPGISRFKAYFLIVHPLSRGTHTMRAYDEFEDGAFVGEVSYTITVH
jgi:hypothetical protein